MCFLQNGRYETGLVFATGASPVFIDFPAFSLSAKTNLFPCNTQKACFKSRTFLTFDDLLKVCNTLFGMIPEQVWDNAAPGGYTPGTPTKSMDPFNWAMGEFITLLMSANSNSMADVASIVSSRRQLSCHSSFADAD